jgi:hypothetical protein
MRAEAEAVVGAGPLPDRKLIREYASENQVAARFEISTGGLLGGETAGLDVMGDGRLVPFKGGIVRRELEPGGEQTAYDAVRKALR